MIFKIIICLLVNTFVFSTSFLSREILGVAYMLIYRNAEGVHEQRKFDNICPKPSPVATGDLWWA